MPLLSDQQLEFLKMKLDDDVQHYDCAEWCMEYPKFEEMLSAGLLRDLGNCINTGWPRACSKYELTLKGACVAKAHRE